MTRGTTRLGAAVAALALASASAASAWSGSRPLVELERDDCAGPVAMVVAAADGSAVFHAVEAGRYVITLPPEAGALTLVVAEGGEGRWISGRLSPVTDGRRYAVGADGRRIVVAVARSGGEIRLRLDGL
jgi:hypothetical protein